MNRVDPMVRATAPAGLLIATLLALLSLAPPLSAQGAPRVDAPAAPPEHRVSLDFAAIELRQALQFILKSDSSIRLVCGEPLSELVTVKLIDVPWRQALESVLSAHDYVVFEKDGLLTISKVLTTEQDGARRMPLVLRPQHVDSASLQSAIEPLLSATGRIHLLGGDGDPRPVLTIIDTPAVLELVQSLLPSIDRPAEPPEGSITKNENGTVSVHLRSYPLAQIPDLLHEVVGRNLFVQGTLPGTVTLDLDGVTWEQALELILRQAGYMFRVENDVVVLSPKELARGDLVTEQFTLRYIDGWDLLPYLEKLLSKEGKISCYSPSQRGDIAIGGDIASAVRKQRLTKTDRSRGRVVAVTDFVEVVASVGERIRSLDVAPRQIEVDVKVVQLERGRNNQFGIDWSAVLSASGASTPTNFPFGPHSGKFTYPFPAPTAGSFTFGSLAADQFTAVLRMIESDETAEVVSEPNVTTLDNIEASILIGTRFPLTKETIDPQTAVRTVTLDEYQDIGIQLVVTPTITGDDRVHMVVHPTVSSFTELVEDRFPIINTREADTQMLLRSGETAVIGGLIEKSERNVERRLPFLGRIPLLGWLFRYHELEASTTELVFFVTPRIVLEPAEVERSMMIDRERWRYLDDLRRSFEELLDE